MKKKIVSLCLVIALLAVAITGATLAYFTDADDETNVFSVGSIDIDLLESTLHRDNDGATDEQIIASDKVYQDYLAEAGENILPGMWVSKVPYVYNQGNNAAYVRIRIVSEAAEWKLIDMAEYIAAQDNGAIERSAFIYRDANGDACTANDDYATVEVIYTYLEPLEPGEVTYYAPIWRFQIRSDVKQTDLLVADLDKIVVYADAIQAETFTSAAEAFAAFDAQENA